MFNTAAYFLAHNLLMRILEIGLFLGFFLHIVQGLLLWRQNSAARPVKYKLNRANTNSKWYSRSMGLLGTLILIFLVVHLSHFWWGTKVALYGGGDFRQHNLYNEMKVVFESPIVVAIYMAGLISLFFHLVHGFQSAFQSFGINHKRYTPIIKCIGWIYSIVICVTFAFMPIAVHLKWLR